MQTQTKKQRITFCKLPLKREFCHNDRTFIKVTPRQAMDEQGKLKIFKDADIVLV